MSTDYHLKCNTCDKVLLVVASGSISYDDKLWRSKEALDELEKFLFAHRGHQLLFDSEHYIDNESSNRGFM